MSTVVIGQPDLEGFLWSQLGEGNTGVKLWTYALVSDWPLWQVRYGIEVQARAGTKSAARERAELLRQQMCAIPDLDWTDGVITYVQPTDGPSWLPDDDGCPRYVARYEVRCHPARSLVAAGSTGTRPAG